MGVVFSSSTRRAIIRVRVFSAKQLTGNPHCRREVLPSLLAGTRVRFEGWIGMLSDLLDREEFFKKQTEECRDLARNAVNADDRAFWELAAKRWNEQLLAAKRASRQKDRPGELQATAQAKLSRAGRSCVKRGCGRAPRLRCPAHRAFSCRSGLWRAGLLAHFSWARPTHLE